MIVKGQKVMSSVSTAFKVHYNQKLGGGIRPSWGDAPWPLEDRRPWSLHTIHYALHTQVLARCPKLNNLKGSCLVSVLGILQHWWNQEQRFGENPELHQLDVMLLTEYDKYQTNTIHTSRIRRQLALITINSIVRSHRTSPKFATKQEQTLHYTSNETNLFST